MKIFSLLRTRNWWMSFYSADLYREVARQWSGIAVWHLLLLAVLIGLPSYLLINQWLNDFYARTVIPIIEQFPTVTIEQGLVTIDKPLPYVIEGSMQTLPYILFSNEDSLPEDAVLPATVVVTKRVIYSHYLANQPPIVRELKVDKTQVITRQQVERTLLIVKRMTLYTFFPLLVAAIFSFALVVVMFAGLLGRLLAIFMGATLTYRQFVRLAVVACTPGVFVGCLLSVFGLAFELSTLPVAVAIGYYAFAIYSNRMSSS
jgi:Protein of unknown function (DUF1189)